jgi:hypothetical protein
MNCTIRIQHHAEEKPGSLGYILSVDYKTLIQNGR